VAAEVAEAVEEVQLDKAVVVVAPVVPYQELV
jgi:hypothetical protein